MFVIEDFGITRSNCWDRPLDVHSVTLTNVKLHSTSSLTAKISSTLTAKKSFDSEKKFWQRKKVMTAKKSQFRLTAKYVTTVWCNTNFLCCRKWSGNDRVWVFVLCLLIIPKAFHLELGLYYGLRKSPEVPSGWVNQPQKGFKPRKYYSWKIHATVKVIFYTLKILHHTVQVMG